MTSGMALWSTRGPLGRFGSRKRINTTEATTTPRLFKKTQHVAQKPRRQRRKQRSTSAQLRPLCIAIRLCAYCLLRQFVVASLHPSPDCRRLQRKAPLTFRDRSRSGSRNDTCLRLFLKLAGCAFVRGWTPPTKMLGFASNAEQESSQSARTQPCTRRAC